jgi:endogenous inhibitor of DNA gyrase (YacG/DUF329 family)
MGEIADMMLDGTLCEACGSYIDGEGGEGFARYCSDRCARDRGADQLTMTRKERHAARPAARVSCPTCAKRVKKAGLAHHMRDVHGAGHGR